ALSVGTTSQQLSNYWLDELDSARPTSTSAVFVSSRAAFDQTLSAILDMLPQKDASKNTVVGSTHNA
ncbi:MAG TPA: hypothetical protein VFV70_07995, partial [Hyphomonadaceae bacterium]|nr:hypothetical protein [Hyphomonadaceae bacterium]